MMLKLSQIQQARNSVRLSKLKGTLVTGNKVLYLITMGPYFLHEHVHQVSMTNDKCPHVIIHLTS